MKSRVRGALILVAWCLTLSMSSSTGIRGTAHDFSTASWNTGGSVCAPCHTPHHAKSDLVPLWNHDTTLAIFTLYSSDTLNAAVRQPTGTSKACLSCHDGTVAINAYGGNTADKVFLGSVPANLGKDLSNDHPVSFVYDRALALADGGLYDPTVTTVPALEGKTIQNGMLDKDELHCTSCHDVHAAKGDAGTAAKLLLVNNNASALCLTCHNK